MAKYAYNCQDAGGYFIGLPARDMSEEEWKSLPPDLTKAALKAKMYIFVKDKNVEVQEVKNAKCS